MFRLFGMSKGTTMILSIIVVVILSIVGFGVAYRLYLHYILGKFLDPLFCKIPVIGPWLTNGRCSESLKIAGHSIAASRANLLSDRPELGTRTTRRVLHGPQCMWYPDMCNPWDKLEKFGATEDVMSEVERIDKMENKRSQLYQKLWEPARRKVFRGLTNSERTDPAKTYQNQKVMQQRIEEKFKGGEEHRVKNGTRMNIRLPMRRYI